MLFLAHRSLCPWQPVSSCPFLVSIHHVGLGIQEDPKKCRTRKQVTNTKCAGHQNKQEERQMLSREMVLVAPCSPPARTWECLTLRVTLS